MNEWKPEDQGKEIQMKLSELDKILETIWSNPEMLSDLPTVAQQGLGFDLTLSTFPFLFFFCFGDWGFARWRFGLAKLYGQMGQRRQRKRNGVAR